MTGENLTFHVIVDHAEKTFSFESTGIFPHLIFDVQNGIRNRAVIKLAQWSAEIGARGIGVV